jgi:hypothetical protein
LLLAGVVPVLDPPVVLDVVLELPEEPLVPDELPVEAVVLPDVVLPDVVVAVVVVPEVVVVVPVPVRSTDPVAVPAVALPVEAETLVDEVAELSLELPPMEPQALNTTTPASAPARHANRRTPARLTRLNNIHPTQSSCLLNSL